MTYGSICSGIEAASVAWHALGWRPAFFSEIEAFPCAVLAHRFPAVPCHGDFTTIGADQYGPIDLLVGGTPCQSFSIAGLRGGLDDSRGNLALEFLRLADRKRPRWLVWENVPGVLSSNGGRDFGSILGGMVELGYGVAYRVLDAQHFGVPQRRRRVFVVGYLGDWRRAAAVLFERHSLSGHSAPRRQARSAVAALTANGVGTCGVDDNQGQAGHLIPDIVGQAMSAKWAKGTAGPAGDEHHNLIPVAFPAEMSGTQCASAVDRSPALSVTHTMAVAYPLQEVGKRTGVSTDDHRAGIGIGGEADPMFTLQAGAQHGVGTAHAVRRLTPTECERLQGFPDGWTDVPHRGKPAADGPRYKALGNSMAVPCMLWLGQRIQQVENLARETAYAA
ncbi:MAG TPA: DNA cytosine methyltransferase [Novosphingobium capsulatum]|nr:DNA cytosine methyltransferase [Novosphingobium capsulatum]